MVTPLRPPTLNLSFTQARNTISLTLKSEGSQLWSYEITVLDDSGTRIITGRIVDETVPGSWMTLTARLFALYPELDVLDDSLATLKEIN